jgi:hypothetical protein
MLKPYIYYLLAPASPPTVLVGLRSLAQQLGDGGTAEQLNFSTPLALASAPTVIVAYCGSTGPVGEYTDSAIQTMIAGGQIDQSVQWVKCANEPYPPRILATSFPATQADIAAGITRVFDLPTALADVGMVLWQAPTTVTP